MDDKAIPTTKDNEVSKNPRFRKLIAWLIGGIGTIAVGLAAVWVQSLLGPNPTMARDLERLIRHAATDFRPIQGRLLYENDFERAYHAKFSFSGRCEDAQISHRGGWGIVYHCDTAKLFDSAAATDEQLRIWQQLRPGLPETWVFGSSDDRSIFVADSPDGDMVLEVDSRKDESLWVVSIYLNSR